MPTLEQALGRGRLAEARGSRAHGRAQDQQRHRPSAAREGARRASASSRKRARASTAWRRPRPARASACRAPCTWARSTSRAKRRTSTACAASARRSCAVKSGDRTLRAAIDEAIRDWVSDPVGTYYLLGSAIGPHPYPYLVRQLQAVIGREARAQMLAKRAACPMPCSPASAAARTRSACSTAFSPIAASSSSASRPAAAAPSSASTRRRCRTASPACCTARTRCCSTTSTARSRRRTRSRPGLDYPGVGPEHALLQVDRPRRVRHGQRRRDAGGARGAVRRPKASCPRSRARTRWPAPSAGPRRIAGSACSSASRAAATRTCRFSRSTRAGRSAEACCRVTAFEQALARDVGKQAAVPRSWPSSRRAIPSRATS